MKPIGSLRTLRFAKLMGKQRPRRFAPGPLPFWGFLLAFRGGDAVMVSLPFLLDFWKCTYVPGAAMFLAFAPLIWKSFSVEAYLNGMLGLVSMGSP